MIYTFKVHASESDREPLETTTARTGRRAGQAKALMERYPECGGVEV